METVNIISVSILSTYPASLYYLDQASVEPAVEKYTEDYDAEFEFDYVYTWQPFTSETNELRDITFYIKDGTVSSIEIVAPFELRYTDGYGGEAGMEYANQQRESSN